MKQELFKPTTEDELKKYHSREEVIVARARKEMGKVLRRVRKESYDMGTFLNDIDELTDYALKGELLPPMVVKIIENIWTNPKYI